MIITDALSRGPHNFKQETNSTEDIEIIESLPILSERLDKLQSLTQAEPELGVVAKMIPEAWPLHK